MQIREFLLERYYALHEFATPFQLSASDCESLSIEELLELGGSSPRELLGQRLGYTETPGAPELRAAIARFYPGCGPDDVLVCNAPQEAVFLAMHALLEAGDRVVVMTPCYQSLKEVARSIGCEVVEWDLVETENGWSLDLEALDRHLATPTRLVVTNAPHNPTGLLPRVDEWRRIAELCRERGVRWFSDEMYRGLESDPGLALDPAAVALEGATSLWGTSKSFGLPGLRIGWLVSRDEALLRKVVGLKDYTSICASAPGELLARVALQAAEPILAKNRALIETNTERMNEFARRHPNEVAWHAPVAGPVALARVLRGPATPYTDRVRETGDVVLVPSALFDLGDEHVRIGLGRSNFAEGLERWERALP